MVIDIDDRLVIVCQNTVMRRHACTNGNDNSNLIDTDTGLDQVDA